MRAGTSAPRSSGGDSSAEGTSPEVESVTRAYFVPQTLRTTIPRNVRLAEAPSFGKPALLYDIGSAGAQAYLALASELTARSRRRGGYPGNLQITEARRWSRESERRQR